MLAMNVPYQGGNLYQFKIGTGLVHGQVFALLLSKMGTLNMPNKSLLLLALNDNFYKLLSGNPTFCSIF